MGYRGLPYDEHHLCVIQALDRAREREKAFHLKKKKKKKFKIGQKWLYSQVNDKEW